MKIKVKLGGPPADQGVWIDGEFVQRCRAVEVHGDAGNALPRVCLTLSPDEVEIEAEDAALERP